MFEETVATAEFEYCLWLKALLASDLGMKGVNAAAPPAILAGRNFCENQLAILNCPCNAAMPDMVQCLDVQGIEIVSEIILPQRVPRAARARSRRSRVVRGRASESSSDGDGGGPSRQDLVPSRGVAP
jgi:hypothetical protein